jgi:hypothetical protein
MLDLNLRDMRISVLSAFVPGHTCSPKAQQRN